MSDVSFGVKTSQSGLTYDEIVSLWLEADQIPEFEHAWLWDHLITLRGDANTATLEAWTLLAALAAKTERLKLGVIVTSNRLRPPAVLAKMAATVDMISAGRLQFGIGAGGALGGGGHADEIVRREYDAYGIDVVPIGEALGALREACEISKRLWTADEPFDYDGRYYQLRDAICEPKPVQRPGPPIMIGTGGERTGLRIVAEHADIWNAPTRTIEEFRHKSRVLDEHCVAIGRDPATIIRSNQLLVAVDGVADVRARIVELVEAGAGHIVLAPMPPWPEKPARWLADEIVRPVIAELG